MANFLGAFHVHSNFSEDGTFDLLQLVRYFKEKKFNFICLAEHNPRRNGEYISEQEYLNFVDECEKASNDNFVVIPGLECEVQGKNHILGIGLNEVVGGEDWDSLVNDIQKKGGIAVLAHPVFFKNKYDNDLLMELDGIEVWNSRYSGGLPDPIAVSKIKKLTSYGSGITGFFGMDFHRPDDYYDLRLIISIEDLTSVNIIKALKEKAYILHSPKCQLSPMAELPFSLKTLSYLLGHFYYKTNKLLHILKNILDNSGIKIPDFIRKYLRKFKH